MVSEKEYLNESRIHSGKGKCHSRLGVQTSQGLKQLGVRSIRISNSNEQNNRMQSRSVCRQNQCQTRQVHQLDARSRSNGTQCTVASLGGNKGVCISPVLSHFSMSEQDSEGKSNDSPCNPSMVSPTMVCNNSEDVHSGSHSPPNNSQSPNVRQGRTSPTSEEQLTPVSRMGCLRRSMQTMHLSQETEDLICNSWGKGTTSSYNSAWKKWVSWCVRREVDPFSAPISFVLDFLSYLYYEGFQYRTINVHRSALSSVMPHVNNLPIGQHSMVKLLMRGILRGNPPLPRYKETWDVDKVLNYFISLPSNEELSLKLLSKKLAMLLAIAAPKRVSEIARLDKGFMQVIPSGVKFLLPGLSKTQRDCSSKEVFYARFPDHEKLCVVECLLEYLHRTKTFRTLNEHSGDPILRSVIKPHKGLTANTVSNWIRDVMAMAGIDTAKFKPHSARSASTSKAFKKGTSVNEVLEMADWSHAGTFYKFYCRSTCLDKSDGFSKAVLTLG
ncbi:uncharacterized protein LOC134252662 [Saccostrea cucullata]|uniref:uncharacterized protein LOC134252662 n=1 Tax=Saccostrea cuccullata TaxID=36930 RepID=UPI002ECFE402